MVEYIRPKTVSATSTWDILGTIEERLLLTSNWKMAGSIKRDPNTVLANTSRDILGSFEATTTWNILGSIEENKHGIYLVLLKKLQLGIYLVPIEERLQLTSYWRLDGSIKGTPALYQHLVLGIYLVLLKKGSS